MCFLYIMEITITFFNFNDAILLLEYCCCWPPPKNGVGVQQPFLRTLADGIPHLAGSRARWCPLLHSTSRWPTSTSAVNKSVTFMCVFMLVQLNKCVVVCGSDLQSLFKYECSMGHLFVLSWARVRRVALVFVTLLCCHYGGVNVFHVCLNCAVVYGVLWVLCQCMWCSLCCLLCCDVV